MFVGNRNEARDYFFQVWERVNKQLPLEPLETIISQVILEHPEYHSYLDNKEDLLNHEFTPEQNQTNPFLHMGMHIALKEQVGTNRPKGISDVFNSLMSQTDSVHDAEHRMMECLGQSLWEAQRNQTLPDESSYLECLKRIA